MNKTLYFNAHVYTANPALPYAEAFAVENGRISFIGFEHSDIFSDDSYQKVDLKCAFVLPGFTDAHAHALDGQLWVGPGDMSSRQSVTEICDGIREVAANTEAGEWVFVSGANLPLFGAYPTRELLDQLVPDQPLLVVNFDVHSAALNSKGLEKAGISRSTEAPAGGVYERDASGEPTGVVHEAGLYKIFPQLKQMSPARFPAAIRQATSMGHEIGVTGWFEARVDLNMLKAYHQAEIDGELKTYVSAGLLAVNHRNLAEQIAEFSRWKTQYEGELLKVHTVKVFIDGVTESRTASLLAPYAGLTDAGEPHWSQAELNEVCELADNAGFDLHFHTLGDRAAHMALNAIEYAKHRNPKRERRIQLAHLQLVADQDKPRFRELGAIASVQGLWCAAPPEQKAFYASLLGAERAEKSYPLRSLKNAGALLAGGSDWPITTMNPFAIMQCATTRQLDANDDPWNAAEILDLQSMMEAHTHNAAYALRFDGFAGSLAVGKDATFLITDQNPFHADLHQLGSIKVNATYFKGERVYLRM
ncbi:amidohydrolase [Leeia oryzae]|uniref:amidohydrolase n=1 Tax=Leeia oryzae TaxID=356662 RepID=UPI0003A00768|nr:amidohydrolase [Leeia oryzae]